MAKPKGSEIERLLRKVVKDAVKNEDEITIRIARSTVESELGLENGFLKNDSEWKSKSKAIIEAAFEEDDELRETATATLVKSITKATPADTRKPASGEVKGKPQPQQKSKQIPSEPQQPPNFTSKVPKPAVAKSAEAQVDQTQDSSGEGSSGDEEDESDETGYQAPVQQHASPEKPEKAEPKVNGVKRKVDDQDTSNATESEEEDDVDTDDEHKAKKAKVDSTSGSEKSSQREDGQGSDDEEGSDEQA